MELTVIFIVSFFAAVLGSMGLGGGFILLIYLTAFASYGQLEAQAINLIFFIPIALVGLCMHAKNKLVLWKEGLLSAVCGIPGVFAGFYLAQALETKWLSAGFAILVFVIGVKELFSKPKREV